jgi:molybdenum cofactor biosynthesis protein MoaC
MTEPSSRLSMADVGSKPETRRRALAAGKIHVGPEAFAMLKERTLPKGDALALAESAGVMAAKQTPFLIPLCHPISLDRVSVHSFLRPGDHSVEVMTLAEISERTGVEMEALCGLSIALLTVWDLVKPVNPALEISGQRLLYKSGGKRGTWVHPDGMPEEARALVAE